MLLPDVADRNFFVIAVSDRLPKDALGQKDALGVVAECAMPEVRDVTLRLIEPVVNSLIVFRPSAEAARTRFRMFYRMSHQEATSRMSGDSLTV